MNVIKKMLLEGGHQESDGRCTANTICMRFACSFGFACICVRAAALFSLSGVYKMRKN